MTQDSEGTSSDAVKIKLLMMVAMADGRWDDREVALLEDLARRLGFDSAKLSRFRQKPSLEVKELSDGLPIDNIERIHLLADLIKMAYADRELHESEMRLLVKLGHILGFDEGAVRDIVEEEG